MRALQSLIWRFANGLALVAGAGLVLMVLQTCADVVLSRLFQWPIEGNMEVVSNYYMVMLVFLPLALVELRHEHINADLFVRMLPRGLQRVLYGVGCLVSLGFFGVLFWQTLQDAMGSLRIGELIMGAVYLPVWPAKFLLPIGFLAILLAFVLHFIRNLVDPAFEPVPADPAQHPEQLPVA